MQLGSDLPLPATPTHDLHLQCIQLWLQPLFIQNMFHNFADSRLSPSDRQNFTEYSLLLLISCSKAANQPPHPSCLSCMSHCLMSYTYRLPAVLLHVFSASCQQQCLPAPPQ